MQEMEVCDAGEDSDVDGLPIDSDETVEAPVNNSSKGARKQLLLCICTCMLLQEMEGCDIGEDVEVDVVPIDSGMTTQAQVSTCLLPNECANS